jgi:glutaredoxin|tara:strand:+ start:83 stop:487 length:405 start_codon:yes stop_codon:yes gene_type:complete
MKEVTIYTNETCPYCKQVKETLNKEKIKFEEKNVRKNEESWQETISLTGMPTLPTIFYDDEYLVPGRDYQNPEQLINILKNFKSSSHSDARKTLERMKTLNFNMHSAFVKIDQLLRQIENKINKTKEDEHESTN